MQREELTELVIRAQQDDADALNDLCEACYQDVHRFILQTVKNPDLAMDLTQDSFVDLLGHLKELKEPAAFPAWMRKIAYHQCTRYFKKKKEVYLDEPEEDELSIFDLVEEDSPQLIPEEALLNKEFNQALRDMTDSLPYEQRSAFIMHHIQRLSIKEIAQIQSVAEGTVKSRLNYSRKSLEKQLDRYAQENEIRFHGVAWMPLIIALLRRRSESICLSPEQFASLQTTVGSAIAEHLAGAGAAATAGTTTSASTSVSTATATSSASAGATATSAATAATAVSKMGWLAKAAVILLTVTVGSAAIVGTVTLIEHAGESANPPAQTTTASPEHSDSLPDGTTSATTTTTQESELPDTPAPALIPEGCVYTVKGGEPIIGNGTDVYFPETVGVGDVYETADYRFTYQNSPCLGWRVTVQDSSQASYPAIPAEINGKAVTSIRETFLMNTSIVIAPQLPPTIVDMWGAFHGCSQLTTAPVIPESVLYLNEAFEFCPALTGEIEIHANPESYTWCFFYTERPIVLTGTSTMLEKLAETTLGGNVTVKDSSNEKQFLRKIFIFF